MLQYAHFTVEGSVAERAMTCFRAHIKSGVGSVIPAPTYSERYFLLHSINPTIYKKRKKNSANSSFVGKGFLELKFWNFGTQVPSTPYRNALVFFFGG